MSVFTDFFDRQLSRWPLAAENFRRLAENPPVALNHGEHGEWKFGKLLANHRRASLTARTDSASIAARPCFLCASNRPAEQIAMDWGDFEILVNPYPLAPVHLTIASKTHRPQTVGGNIDAMLRLTEEMKDMCVFFNGARCGASAPDHLHFQAVPVSMAANLITNPSDAPFRFRILDGASADEIERICVPEEMVNIAMIMLPDGRVRTAVIPRRRHRPLCYGSGEGQLTVSPATIEMLGTIVCSRREDFDRIDLTTALSIIAEVGETPDFQTDIKTVTRHE